MDERDLDDGTADRQLLDAQGVSLLVFHSQSCPNCRLAQQRLPAMALPADQLFWVDAARNGGLVQRYEVFHLPAIYVVRDGAYYGPISAQLEEWDLRQQIGQALDNHPAELP
ncbi:thioredoxin [Bordetella trematum]|uniref:Thioredoxin n=1 Tax=Bordetella trematum TaxID=123899 RepID=A0A157SNH3_9BORD|nr:thioredoxin family protein [Bordetella trematum]AUL47052.1 thioredoxin [Bordetella trematum]AZR93852.1 thioredoxin [Bordetella trematum]NNH18978.1 thioredoxin family protein [Bordetella trematum]QIM72435.1 thioredoxin [Bordetella trematum]SAI02400.1 thioredoxin [Bordetella trematum]